MNKQLVTFRVNQEIYGVDILEVDEIVRMQDITKIPQSPKGIKGVINLRGKICPLLSLREKMDISQVAFEKTTSFVIIKGFSLGLIVDEVKQIITVTDEMIQPINSTYLGDLGHWFRSLVKFRDEIIAVLNIDEFTQNIQMPEET